MWNKLKSHIQSAQETSISGLFSDPDRAEKFSVSALDMLFDYSKTSLTDSCVNALTEMLEDAGFTQHRAAMLSGDHINETEDRAVLHTALRAAESDTILEDGQNVVPEVHETLRRMSRFTNALRDGTFKGQGGAITDVVNIGIGGSDLGPAMAVSYTHLRAHET